MKKIFDGISAVLFFMLVIMFAAATVMHTDPSDFIGRSKTADPAQAAEELAEENFPIPENWRSMYSMAATMLGQHIVYDVYIYEDRLIDIFTVEEASPGESGINEINSFSESYPDIPMYVMLVPTASGIYSADLPAFNGAADQQSLIDDIYYRLDSRIVTLDAFNPLFTCRDDYVYFRTDSRWTSLGAFMVYSRIAPKLGYQPLGISNYDIEYADRAFYGDLYRKTFYTGVSADTINVFRNKNGSYVTGTSALSGGQEFTSKSVYYSPALGSPDKYSYFLGGDYFERFTITTSNEAAPRLLVIKGDYANCFVPFLTPHYSEITLIDPGQLKNGSFYDFADPSDFDQILFLFDIDDFVNRKDLDRLRVS